MENIKPYFEANNFEPNSEQGKAINHVEGPLLIKAGPGSGKTRVLLWRTFNLIVSGKAKPNEIFLSTFTEKAAKQLKDGLLALLGTVEDIYFDTSEMYVGTVHSLCRRILTDRRFNSIESSPPELLDNIDQYFHVYDMAFWPKDYAERHAFAEKIGKALKLNRGVNKHQATVGLITFFNRLSEEFIDSYQIKENSDEYTFLVGLYRAYLASLADEKDQDSIVDIAKLKKVDMSLLQRKALTVLQNSNHSEDIFKYVLIDEYQDTNKVQESIFFELTKTNHNLCVVGDDDQSLYRFRGATVENIVQFSKRCHDRFNKKPDEILLNINYRSRPEIVEFYNDFIKQDNNLNPKYRLAKNIKASRKNENGIAVITTNAADISGYDDIAELVKNLINNKKVKKPNQIAFIFPSVKSKKAKDMIEALEKKGLAVYSPRSNPLFESDEVKLIFGLFLQVLDKSKPENLLGRDFTKFHTWLDECKSVASETLESDQSHIQQLIEERKQQLEEIQTKEITWNLLDLFYEFLSCDPIKALINDAEQGENELAVYNLSQITQYIARYQGNRNITVIKRSHIDRQLFGQDFLNKYLYGLFRLGETEYEDQENPFPEGKIPFLTIHQAKGLEFPVVVLGDTKAFKNNNNGIEDFVRPLIKNNANLEPINHISDFDAMRMFYVALSRAENLLVLIQNNDCQISLLKAIEDRNITKFQNYSWETLPEAKKEQKVSPKTYSYTADYQSYLSCPRHYMLFRKYGFSPARSRTMAFGVLVHKTIEDIHRRLLDEKQDDNMVAFIEQRFYANYQTLLNDSSHRLSKNHIEIAKQQALHYWIINEALARRVTHTEVPLTLPNLKTEQERIYSIFGVVDMAEEGERLELYDIKTHAADHVRANEHLYQEQLNVYAKIWQDLHKKELDGVSIIATKLPNDSHKDIPGKWQPVVSLKLDNNLVDQTIRNFGEVVDAIEDKKFLPRPKEELYATKPSLASELCSSCDGRFSCDSYHNNSEIEFNENVIDEFIDYLVSLIKSEIKINHSYIIDRRNHGFPKHLKGHEFKLPYLKSGYFKYWWNEKNFKKNRDDINLFLEEMQSDDNSILFKACLKCLKWGSRNMQDPLYKKNAHWLKKQIRSGRTVVDILNEAYMDMSQNPPKLSEFKNGKHRMNSGYTKIYALRYPNFIIYDSRVGAALGFLSRLFCESKNHNHIPKQIAFPWAGKPKRDPSKDNFKFKSFENKPATHAEWNIKTNIILKKAVEKAGDFWGIANDQSRLRAVEAALFMIGYSVNDNNQENTRTGNKMAEQRNPIQQNQACTTLWNIEIPPGPHGNTSWSPTGHQFSDAIRQYLQFRAGEFGCTFENWLLNQIPPGPKDNKYIQNRNEFNFINRDIEIVEAFARFSQSDTYRDRAKSILEEYKQEALRNKNFENFPKIIMCTYFIGMQCQELNSAQSSVGVSFGKHCEFLDDNSNPTPYFNKYFLNLPIENELISTTTRDSRHTLQTRVTPDNLNNNHDSIDLTSTKNIETSEIENIIDYIEKNQDNEIQICQPEFSEKWIIIPGENLSNTKSGLIILIRSSNEKHLLIDALQITKENTEINTILFYINKEARELEHSIELILPSFETLNKNLKFYKKIKNTRGFTIL